MPTVGHDDQVTAGGLGQLGDFVAGVMTKHLGVILFHGQPHGLGLCMEPGFCSLELIFGDRRFARILPPYIRNDGPDQCRAEEELRPMKPRQLRSLLQGPPGRLGEIQGDEDLPVARTGVTPGPPLSTTGLSMIVGHGNIVAVWSQTGFGLCDPSNREIVRIRIIPPCHGEMRLKAK